MAFATSLAAQWVCAFVLGGRLHHDEVHQYLEQAHRVVFGFGSLPHEYLSGMRNWLAPGALSALFFALKSLGLTDARWLLGVTHCGLGCLSLYALACAWDLVHRATRSLAHARLAALAVALWVPSANLAFRTLGEGFSVVTLMAALRALTPADDRPLTAPSALRAGLWMGLGFVVRYPAGVFVVPVVAVLLARREGRCLAAFCAGVGAMLAGLALLDVVTWGAPLHSVFAYADYNLVRDRARIDFGARPPWFYAAWAAGFGPLALYALSPPWKPSRALVIPASVIVGYLAVMASIAHKEPRFFLPVLPALIALLVALRPAWGARRQRWLLAGMAAQSLAVLAALWTLDVCEGDEARAAMRIGRANDVAAVAALTTYHPGYVLLRQRVPVVYDPRGEPSRALVALRGMAWPTRGRVYAYGASASMTAAHRTTLRAMGFTRAFTVGRAEVWVR